MPENTSASITSKPLLSHRHKILVMVGLILGCMTPTFYSLARANVQPSIVAWFNGMQFYAIVAITAVLTMAVCTPISGRLGDMYGRKKLYIGSCVVYLISLIGCAFAPNLWFYVICTALSGGSQGFISALINAIIADVVTAEERPKYVGYNSTASVLIQLVGPILSGFIADAYSWRVLFLIGTPLLLISGILLARFLPSTQSEVTTQQKVDIMGAVTFLFAIVPILILLSLGGTMIPWISGTTLAILAISVVFTIVLVRVDTRHPAPMISFYIFHNRAFLKLFLACLLFSIGNSMNVYFPYYLQNVVGVNLSVSGTLLTPRALTTLLATIAVGAIMSKTGKYKEPLLIMLALTIISYAAMGFLFEPTTSIHVIIATTAINGLGNTALIVAAISISMKVLEPKDIGVGVSLLTFVSALAGSLGNAIGGMLTNNAWKTTYIPEELQSVLSTEHIAKLSATSILKDNATLETIRSTLDSEMGAVLDNTIMSFRETLGHGVDYLFLVMSGAALVALILIWTMKLPEKAQTPKQ